jgi:hypothetical protein
VRSTPVVKALEELYQFIESMTPARRTHTTGTRVTDAWTRGLRYRML